MECENNERTAEDLKSQMDAQFEHLTGFVVE